MNKNEILEIVKEFEISALTKFNFEKGDLKLAMAKEVFSAADRAEKRELPLEDKSEKERKEESKEENREAKKDDINTVEVKTPIVGVFYEAPSPDDEPYVKEGQEVKAGQVLCLVEAMKMMNELKAPCDGTVRKIYGVNGQLVEFDQVVFEVEPC